MAGTSPLTNPPGQATGKNRVVRVAIEAPKK
jgi:hypothetical protein